MVIVTEGKTEKIYFIGLKQRLSNVEIKTPRTSPTDALSLVKLCAHHIEENDLNIDDGDLAICVFDIEGNPKSNLKKAAELANDVGIILATTDPCFELWYVLHFREVDHKVTCIEAHSLLKEHIEDYSKTTDYRWVLSPKSAFASRNAQSLWVGHLDAEGKWTQTNPSTSVHLAIEAIEELIRRNATR